MRGLPLDDAPKIQCRLRLVSGLIALSVIGILLLSPDPRSFNRTAARDFQRLPISCPIQHSALSPGISFSLRHKERVSICPTLQGAVQLRTETFDGAPQDGNNPWYDKFYEFEAYLLETFPDV
jgi:Gly-Xaa carboxypeptidase